MCSQDKCPYLRICLLILDREEGRERGGGDRERGKETLFGCLPYVPRPGMEPAT